MGDEPTLTRPAPVAFIPQRQPAKPVTQALSRGFRLRAGRRPADRHPRTGGRHQTGGARSGAARRHRLGQDLHHGEGHRGGAAAGLVLAPNKTLAAQLYGEMKSFFPDNAVEYFVSYYDYYQPEAYVAAHRHLYRKRLADQRTDRPHAPCGDAVAAGAQRRDHRGLRSAASTVSARSRPIRAWW